MTEGQDSPDDAAMDRRIAERHISVLINAGISHADADALCRIRNLSAGGVMIECPLPLAEDDVVELQLRSGHRIGGLVRWVREGQAGIAFDDPASAALVNGASPAGKRLSIRKQQPHEDVSPVGYPLFRRQCWAQLAAGHKRGRAPVVMISPTGLIVEALSDWTGETLFGVTIEGLGRLPARVSDSAASGDGETIALLFVEPVHYRTFNEWLLVTPQGGAVPPLPAVASDAPGDWV